MKKKWLLVLFLAMMAVVLTGCGSEKATKAEFFEYIVTTEDTIAITAYTGNEMKVVIPSKIDGKKVTHINFSKGTCGIMGSVVIPDGVTYIAEDAFNSCDTITSIVVPNSVTYIGDCAFFGCDNLTSITLPERVEYFKPYFLNAKIENITLPQGTTEITNFAFRNCVNLKEIVIPEGIEEIGKYAFDKCSSLEKVTLPNGIFRISRGAFSGCSKLTRLELPEGLLIICAQAFEDCSSLEYINIPASVEVIGIPGDGSAAIGSGGLLFSGSPNVKIHVKKGSEAVEYFEEYYHKYLVIE